MSQEEETATAEQTIAPTVAPSDEGSDEKIEENMDDLKAELSNLKNQYAYEKELNQTYKENLELLKAQQTRSRAEEDTDDAIDETDEDKYARLEKKIDKIRNEGLFRFQRQEEAEFMKEYPDYREVVDKYILKAAKNAPNFADYIAKNYDYRSAYFLCKTCPDYRKDLEMKNKKVKENAMRSTNISSIPSARPNEQDWMNMPEEEFWKKARAMSYAQHND